MNVTLTSSLYLGSPFSGMSLLWIFSLQIPAYTEGYLMEKVPNLSLEKKSAEFMERFWTSSNTRQSFYFALCPFICPSHSLSITEPHKVFFSDAYSPRETNKAWRRAGLLEGGGRTTESVPKGMAQGHDAILPNVRGEPSTGGASVLHKVGTISFTLLKSPQTPLASKVLQETSP